MWCKVNVSLLDQYLFNIYNGMVTLTSSRDKYWRGQPKFRRNPIFHLCDIHRQGMFAGIHFPACLALTKGWKLFLPATWECGMLNSQVYHRAVCKTEPEKHFSVSVATEFYSLCPYCCPEGEKQSPGGCSSLWVSAYLGVRLSVVLLSKTIKWEETITRVVMEVMNLGPSF